MNYMAVLNRIVIKGLYGHYTYDLPLRAGQRKKICFLTGPNGYGKTTILDLVKAFLRADVKTLLEVPYDSVTFYLKDYMVVLIQECIEVEKDINDVTQLNNDEVQIVRRLTYVVYTAHGDQMLERLSITDESIGKEGVSLFPLSLSVYLASIHVEYVEDDRLWPRNEDKLGVSRWVSLLQKMVSDYDEHLTSIYNKELLAMMGNFQLDDFSREGLKEDVLLDRAEEKLAAFNKLGLALKLVNTHVQKGKRSSMLIQMAAVDVVLSFDDIFYKRLNLLYEILVRAEFSDKIPVIDSGHGLIFKTDNTIILPEYLSSGEQHFVVQLIVLLMKSEPGAVILIDEPEMSYHPAWQMDYFKNLKQIAEVGDFQFIIATHSPQIFGYHWGYTIDLFKQTTKNAERPE